MKRFLKITLLSLFVLLALGAGGFLLWAETPARPQAAALAALQSDDLVTVSETHGYLAFQPTRQPPKTGFIFYPGGRVDYRAYAPILHQIAAQGFLVILVPVRLNLAFFDLEAGAPALTDFPQVKTWAVGGHSLGGVAASLFASNHPQVQALILWASYPPDDSLKSSSLPVLSIYGSQDGQAAEVAERSRTILPANAQIVVIEGGNHAQFGDYGPQAGDNPAEISAENQWKQTTQAVTQFLKALK